jgi:diguanylate cyclase (GGDEF)-like protein
MSSFALHQFGAVWLRCLWTGHTNDLWEREMHGLRLENPLSSELSSASSVQARDDSRRNVSTQEREERDSCRVLLVDDDALVLARLSALLHASDYEVEVASTGEEALRILDSTHCHIVLTDWQMPDMDGLALCRHIRLGDHENYVYVLMLTVRDTEHDVMIGLAAGADDYMVKGTTINDILARLEIGRRITQSKSTHRAKSPGNRGLSYTDPLTGAHNLGYLAEHLPRELARSQRYGHALAILHCDVDRPGVNGHFSHASTNGLLRMLVAGAESVIRKGDWLARTAGASFMIVLPETTALGAHCAAHKLRQFFAKPLSTGAEHLGFTVSIGVTAVDAGHDALGTAQIDALLRMADRGTHADRLFGAQADGDAVAAWASGFGSEVGGKNGLN